VRVCAGRAWGWSPESGRSGFRGPARADWCGSLFPGVAFFGPGVAVHVVAVLFPEAGGVFIHEFDAADPFGAFPEVEFGDDEAGGETVVGLEGFCGRARWRRGQSSARNSARGRLVVKPPSPWTSTCLAEGLALTWLRRVFGFAGSAEDVIDTAPAGDAVDVALDVDPGQGARRPSRISKAAQPWPKISKVHSARFGCGTSP